MKLGIVVVYMVDERHHGLLDLHLARIARHTRAPYVIHGSANRLLPRFREKLARTPQLVVHDLEPTELRGSLEHSWYLEQLVKLAIDDGATHVVTLHVDSFPVADDWEETLARRAGPTFATLDGISTACLFFPRTFHEVYSPRFQVAGEVQKGERFGEFVRHCSPVIHSGVGYGFAAYEAGLRWYSMPVTARTADPNGSLLSDDLHFHLQGAVRLAERASERNAAIVERIGQRRFAGTIRAVRDATPAPIRRVARAILPLHSTIDAPRQRWMAAGMAGELERLLDDPDLYLEQLRERGLAGER